MLEVKSESTVSGGTEEIADRGNRDRDAAQDLQCAARELWGGKLNDTKEESSRDKKHKGDPGEMVAPKKFTLEELSETFHNIESPKDKILEADPN